MLRPVNPFHRIALPVLALALLCCGAAMNASGAEVFIYKNPTVPVDQRVRDLLARMTVEEKIDQLQCQFIADPATMLDGHKKPRNYNVGFIYHYTRGSKPSEIARKNNEDQRNTIEESRLGIPALMHQETLHGIGCIPSTLFPVPMGIAATWDPELAYRCYLAISREGAAVNIRQHFSPCLYFCRDARWGRVEETYGEDALMNTRFGLQFVKAIRDAGAVPTLKGYPVNYGDGGRDSYATYYSERQLRELYFQPFEAAVRQYGDVMSVMPSYNSNDGTPIHASRWLLTDVLRGEWGYRGIVTSDYGDHANGAVYLHAVRATPAEGAAMVLHAGLDSNHPNGMDALPNAVTKGLVTPEELNATVARVLRVKFLAGLFDKPYVNEAEADKIVRCAEHQQLALEQARKAIVLLKNEKQTLPLKKAGTIGLMGPAANKFFSGGYGRYTLPTDITPFSGMTQRAGKDAKILLHDGTSDPAAFAKKCDAVVMFAAIVEGEAFDRCSLDLPVFKGAKRPKAQKDAFTIIVEQEEREFTEGDQEAMIRCVAKTGVPIVVVLVTGAPVTMQRWIDRVPAVIQMWTAGEKGGLAIADVLFGEVNPGGRLPMTFPRSVGQVPLYYNFPPGGRSNRYWDDDGKPLFPFGYGLSYTSFAQSNLKVVSTVTSAGAGEVTASVDVKNTGNRPGDDVVQVYLHPQTASVVQPLKALKGFQRVTLLPGELKTVTVRIPAADLAIWNAEMKRVIEPGGVSVMVGENAEDLPLTGRFVVAEAGGAFKKK